MNPRNLAVQRFSRPSDSAALAPLQRRRNVSRRKLRARRPLRGVPRTAGHAIGAAGSGRPGDLRHTRVLTESCCLPALTRFMGFSLRRTRPPTPSGTGTFCEERTMRASLSAPAQTSLCDAVSVRVGFPFGEPWVVRAAGRSARAAESARLESVCGATHRGFESHLLRQFTLPAGPASASLRHPPGGLFGGTRGGTRRFAPHARTHPRPGHRRQPRFAPLVFTCSPCVGSAG